MPKTHNPDCECAKCTRKLLAAHDRYFRAWVRNQMLAQKRRLDEIERTTSPHYLAGYD